MARTEASTSVLIGHDGSSGADRALSVGLDLAERLRSPVEIIRTFVIDDYPATVTELLGYPSADQELAARFRAELESDTASVVSTHPDLVFEYEARPGRPADVLCAAAADARMLVVGSRGRGGFTGLLLGSVSNECLHRSAIPVLVVPDSGRQVIGAVPAGPADPSPAIAAGTIVVGHDGSHHADVALGIALGLAEDLDAPVSVIRSWTIDTAPTGSVWDKGYVSSFAEISARVSADLELQLRPALERHPSVDVTAHGIFGGAQEVLLRSSVGALMLVLGTRGRGGFQGLLLGSVSSQCADRANCPVLVVPDRS
ncbi:universal stress protein [Lacisediminihabitans changchengi]|uniref:Universal stress protein n=1 Tax=Lacisediminihabitans changchengi TaxID=2787634 RepID=A0A934SNZ9_9MICO|nr:universal stress protein [Lacisediminihabitans changchengi]MBK4348941.1 universal stress protein [Lacisediminihabitans changchengi]